MSGTESMASWIAANPKRGRYTFSREEVAASFPEMSAKVLSAALPHSLKHRRRPMNNPIPIRNRVSIDQRPEIVSRRQRFGDLEMDTIVGHGGKGVIVTIVERLTKKLLMAYCPKDKNAKALAKVVVALLRPYEFFVHTITTDNGTEFAEHEYIARKLHCHVYFVHPYSS